MYTIVCLVYGSNLEMHADLPAAAGMLAEKGDSCRMDYEQTARSWVRVLGPPLRESPRR